jgi:hypothetical protein
MLVHTGPVYSTTFALHEAQKKAQYARKWGMQEIRTDIMKTTVHIYTFLHKI